MEQIALGIKDAMKASGLGRNKLYEAINSGELQARKAGRRTLILTQDLRKFVESLPSLSQSNSRPSTAKESANGCL